MSNKEVGNEEVVKIGVVSVTGYLDVLNESNFSQKSLNLLIQENDKFGKYGRQFEDYCSNEYRICPTYLAYITSIARELLEENEINAAEVFED